jgi:hypothetical protein
LVGILVIMTYLAFSLSFAKKFAVIFSYHISYPFEKYIEEKIIGFFLGFMIVSMIYSFAFKNEIFHKIFLQLVFIYYVNSWFAEHILPYKKDIYNLRFFMIILVINMNYVIKFM